jgi:hypothetical protein
MRKTVLAAGVVIAVLAVSGPAFACGGLIAADGAIALRKTTTLSAYVDGVEHYVTEFEFTGTGAKFGSIVPLPDVPRDIQKGGDWTLERLIQEIQPPLVFDNALRSASAAGLEKATVIQTAEVGALDVTVLKGGGDAVGVWAEENGFDLSPDAPEVLDFYAERSPIFMAVKFNPDRSARQGVGEGEATAIHLTIPTDDPWVPLRILSLGKSASEVVRADVFLLTEQRPAMLPGTVEPGSGEEGLILRRSEPANELLLTDLASDRGMKWLPTSGMWFTYLGLRQSAGDLTYDLALDTEGGTPSRVDAGLQLPAQPRTGLPVWLALGLLGLLLVAAIVERSSVRTAR